MSYTTVQEVFDKGMKERFRAPGNKVTGLFAIKGVGSYLVKIDGDSLVVDGPNADGEFDIKLVMTPSDFLDLANGKGSMQLLFMTGRIGVEGDLVAVMKLVKCFAL